MALPYLEIYTVRRRRFAYYRRAGVRRRLLAEDGRPVDPDDAAALTAAWQRAHAAHEAADAKAAAAAPGAAPGTLGHLIQLYRASEDWARRRPETKRDYEKALVPLERDFGALHVKTLLRRHVMAIRDRYAWREVRDPATKTTAKVDNSRQADRVVTVLSILLSYAVDPLGWRQDNPAFRPKRLHRVGEGYRPWTKAEFLAFWAHHGPEWRFAALLALLSGQRGQDQVRMRWSDYDGESIFVAQQKGNETVKLWVPCHAALKAALDERRELAKGMTPAPLTLLWRPGALPWGANAFQKAAGVAIREAGLQGLVWHGLRATVASWASEGGADERSVAELLGHRQVQTTRRYGRGASQRKLAARAVEAVVLPWERDGNG